MHKGGKAKPDKKTDAELNKLLTKKIKEKNYLFSPHARQRLKDREINDIEVLDILEGKKGRKRKRNKAKDKYENSFQDWNYCFEGCNLDDEEIRIIISFSDDMMVVITVIAIK